MPLQTIKIGPFNQTYVGEYGSLAVLTTITALSTGNITFTEGLGETFFPGLQETIQTGLHEVTMNCSFIGDDDTVLRVSRGLTLIDDKDDPPEFTEYTFLFLHPDEDEKSSILIPRARVVHNLNLTYSKSEVTITNLNITYSSRDRYDQLYHMDTASALSTILAGRSPI